MSKAYTADNMNQQAQEARRSKAERRSMKDLAVDREDLLAAAKALTLTPGTRAFLIHNDPMALKQAEEAICKAEGKRWDGRAFFVQARSSTGWELFIPVGLHNFQAAWNYSYTEFIHKREREYRVIYGTPEEFEVVAEISSDEVTRTVEDTLRVMQKHARERYQEDKQA